MAYRHIEAGALGILAANWCYFKHSSAICNIHKVPQNKNSICFVIIHNTAENKTACFQMKVSSQFKSIS